jgi:hypothetical protein
VARQVVKLLAWVVLAAAALAGTVLASGVLTARLAPAAASVADGRVTGRAGERALRVEYTRAAVPVRHSPGGRHAHPARHVRRAGPRRPRWFGAIRWIYPVLRSRLRPAAHVVRAPRHATDGAAQQLLDRAALAETALAEATSRSAALAATPARIGQALGCTA